MLEDALRKIKNYLDTTSLFFNTFVKAGSPPGFPSCLIKSGWIYPGCCEMSDAEVQEVAARNGFFAAPLKWRHDRQQWWVWCLIDSKAKCQQLQLLLPFIPHVA